MRVVFAGGGTGGHLMPALAVASALKAAAPDAAIDFVGTTQGLEAKKAPEAGYAFHAVRGAQIKGAGFLGAVRGAFAALAGIFDARGLLKKLAPNVVVCVGGYAAFASGVAAWMRGIPLVVLEQNAIPGRVNRFLARLAALVVVPFDEAAKFLRAKKLENIGNPVRPELLERFDALRAKRETGPFRVFVFGGSQGAHRLNEATKSFAEANSAVLGKDLCLAHQVGPREFEQVRAFYSERKLDVEALSFIEDMAAVYASADVVFCRAGATSIAELTALGLPSVLIPYPFAADDHQKANAEILRKAGAAEVIEDAAFTGDVLEKMIASFRGEPQKLAAMSAAARAFGKPAAAADVAKRVLALGGMN